MANKPPSGDPPAGDPPAGDPPAGDPPAGDPPAGDKEIVEVRILYETNGYACGALASLTAAEAAAAVVSGWADDHPDAVAYAKAQAA